MVGEITNVLSGNSRKVLGGNVAMPVSSILDDLTCRMVASFMWSLFEWLDDKAAMVVKVWFVRFVIVARLLLHNS